MGQERWGAEEFHGINLRRDRKGCVFIGGFNVNVQSRDGLAIVVDELSIDVDQDKRLVVGCKGSGGFIGGVAGRHERVEQMATLLLEWVLLSLSG